MKFFKTVLPRVFLDTKQQFEEAQLLMVASSLAYITILSIIPLLAVSFAIFYAFGGTKKLYALVEPFILSNLAHGAGDQAILILHRFIDNTHTAAIGAGGVIGLIFTSFSMLSSVEKAINQVWQAKMRRSLFQRVSSYWLFMTLGPLALSIAVGVATSSRFPLSKLFPSEIGTFFISTIFFFCIYKWVPHLKVNSIFALISSIVTAIFWNLAQFGYSLYIQHVITYDLVYGSLGAVPIVLLWIYIMWIVVLGGAALTAALQKRAEKSIGF